MTAVDGLLRPRLRFLEAGESEGASSMSNTKSRKGKGEPPSLASPDLTPFFGGFEGGTSPSEVDARSDAANARVCRLVACSAWVKERVTLAVSRAMREVFMWKWNEGEVEVEVEELDAGKVL